MNVFVRRDCRGRRVALAALLATLVLPGVPAAATDSFTVGDGVATTLQPVTIPVTMTHDAAAAGYIVAVAYDTTRVSVAEVTVAGTIVEGIAEGVFADIFEGQGGFTLGVILDFEPPFDGQTVPASPDVPQIIALFQLTLDALDNGVVPLDLVDGVFNNPPVDNVILQVGGGEIGVAEGLVLGGGSLTIDLDLDDSVRLEDFAIAAGAVGEGRVLMTNSSGPVSGFVVALDHPAELALEAIDITGTVTEAVGAEFVDPQIFPTGGSVTVVLDAVPPFDGQSIPPQDDGHIVSFFYSCVTPPQIPEPPLAVLIEFDANATVLDYGGPLLTPALVAGLATCEPIEPPQPPDTVFYCGTLDETGIDVVDILAGPGDGATVTFFYSDPTDEIGGFQIAVTLDCQLELVEGSFSIAGTVVEAAGAEFVASSIDNDPTDGDGCELTAGILLDSVPPFDGQSVPMTVNPLAIAHVGVLVDPTAPPGNCLAIAFTDGVNGGEAIPIENIVIIGTASVDGFMFEDGQVCVVDEPAFRRGDCNADGAINIVDGIFLLDHLFQGAPPPDCLEACDFNGVDGLGLTDAVFAFNFLFSGGPLPPAPYPQCGIVPGAPCAEFPACP